MSARKNTAVVVVDMQERFLSMLDKLTRRQLVHNHLEVLDYCRENDVPVVGIRHDIVAFGKEYVYAIENKIAEVSRNRYFWKDKNDGFSNLKLQEYLSSLGIERLCLMGVFASRCVISTGQGALNNGFKIATSRDLITDSNYSQALLASFDWFNANGTLFDRYQDMLRTL
ncbi:MAG: isochorismatase family protein [Nanoarchaeota archaeon]